jgi:hypothetical protein
VGNERVFRPERETTRAVLTAVDIKIETRFLIGIWKPTPISGVMLASTSYKSLLDLQHCFSDLKTV